jgi:glycosyltransferase involved in cell wall biosynthesis
VVTSAVVALLPGGEYAGRIRALAIPVHDLGMQRGVPGPQAIWQLNRLLRNSAPSIVQTWMYHADLLGALATRGMAPTKLVWNIRHSNLERDLNRALSLWTVRLCARLSHWAPAAIVCNSVSAQQTHVDLGYAAQKFVVIPNGFDTDVFQPDATARVALHADLGLAPSTLLVGMVGRFHEQKDHATFVQAAALLRRSQPTVHFVLCGIGVDRQNEQLARWIADAGVADVMHLLGPRTDVPQIMAGFDLLCSSSAGEGFPNVVGEAMACAVPCVVTDVGDAAMLVGDTGFVAPPRQPKALAAALAHAVNLDPVARAQLGSRARQRIITNFSIQQIAARYTDLYLSLAVP